MLATMRHVVLPGTGYGMWHAPDGNAPAPTWAEYLCGVAERDERRLLDWRHKLSCHQAANAAFHHGCSALQTSAPRFPATRGLVHADLLLNHLVGPDETVVAVFDWANALAGDPLYDVAWITYCIPWFPAIDRAHVLELTREHFPDDDVNLLLPLYELHIAVASLQYMAFADDIPGMQISTGRIGQLLSTHDRV